MKNKLAGIILATVFLAVAAAGCAGGTGGTDAAAPVALSDDLYSYQVRFDGVVYTLPFAYGDLAANGWTFEEGGGTLGAHMVTPDMTLTKEGYGDKTIDVSLLNDTDGELAYEECMVGGFTAYDGGAELVLPKGITIGSTEDDVTAAYGQPEFMETGGTHTAIGYGPSATGADTYTGVGFQTDLETKQVFRIIIRNAAGAQVEVQM